MIIILTMTAVVIVEDDAVKMKKITDVTNYFKYLNF